MPHCSNPVKRIIQYARNRCHPVIRIWNDRMTPVSCINFCIGLLPYHSCYGHKKLSMPLIIVACFFSDIMHSNGNPIVNVRLSFPS